MKRNGLEVRLEPINTTDLLCILVEAIEMYSSNLQ